MDETSIFPAQLTALRDELEQAVTSVEAERIDPGLRDAVRSLFVQAVHLKTVDLADLGERVATRRPTAADWEAFERHRLDCGELFDAVLGFLEGALLRGAGLDGGMCDIADALLAEIAAGAAIHWQGITLMDRTEQFASATSIVRLRFPPYSVWNLPIAVHELGHFAGPVLRDRFEREYPFGKMLEAARDAGGPPRAGADEPPAYHRLHELFADLFAVYTVGPAYVAAALLLRFDPSAAFRRSGTHPTFAERAHFMLEALDRIDRESGVARPFAGVRRDLARSWQRAVALWSPGRELDDAACAELETTLTELYDLLKRMLPVPPYKSVDRARELMMVLSESGGRLDGSAADYRLTDALNAAWLSRLGAKEEELRGLGTSAVRLCRTLADRPGRAGRSRS